MWVSVEPDLFNRLYNEIISSSLINKYVNQRIYDSVQENAIYPYVVVGETNTTTEETANSMEEDVAITIHAYSQVYNRNEAASMIRDIAFVVNKELEIPQYEFIRSRISVQQVITDIDQYTKHGILRLLFKYRHKTRYEGE
ncbi:tail completion protein gp17 [Staphylococcus arlettae]